ncbi:hypothetical protein [Pseudodesulfovibrio tunisiensis]|uniref:hypothetical protein n=1 Tax=Pseudodesulfovibrio tunisiensis TaxID=463192 RepID=UPI001FB20F02|nr:hypothetical protein [Pseudodesulfovibrio tunisiensis]
MRINIPRVHGETPKEKIVRSLLLLLVFAAVVWAFTENNKRVIQRLNRDSAVMDQTGMMTDEDKDFVRSFIRTVRDEFGIVARVQVFAGPVESPEVDAKTLYIGLSPAEGQAVVVFPPLVRRAVGEAFVESLTTEHFLPSFDRDDWIRELQIVLTLIFTQLTDIEGGEAQ